MHELLASLNEQQRQAVQACDGPVLILAGAGSGKTKTLIHRIAYLIAMKKARPENILAVTFTNKAAGEMKERLMKLMRLPKRRDVAHNVSTFMDIPTMGTFHSVCAQILRREITVFGYTNRFVIYDSNDSDHVIKTALKNLGHDPKKVAPAMIKALISRAKNKLLDPSSYAVEAKDTIEEITAQIYAQYQTTLKENNALDFDDLIRLTVKLFQEQPERLAYYQTLWQYILVDEYQDTNHAQLLLVQLLSQTHHNICVVGDDFQSIYAWRGADVQNILEFEDHYPTATTILLEQNYRSTKHILEAANAIIKHNTRQKPKTLWTDNGYGHKITIKQVDNEDAEGDYIIQAIFGIADGRDGLQSVSTEDIQYVNEDVAQEESLLDRIMRSSTFQGYQKDQALERQIKNLLPSLDLTKYVILYRTNAQSRALEEAFLRYNVPYRIVGGIKFYERREIKDLIAYVRVLANPNDWVSLERISNVPARALGKTTWLKIEQYCREHHLSYLTVKHPPVISRTLQQQAFQSFQSIMKKLDATVSTATPSELLSQIVQATKFTEQFDDHTPEGQYRLENIAELKSVTKKFDHLTGVDGISAFLEQVSLMSDQDELDEKLNAVNLMTIHAAKGLEFNTVFIVGMEEGLFPHARTLFEPRELEEERRLCYVALTRAKEQAYILYTAQRTVYGNTQISAPSRFIKDLPKTVVHEA